MGNLSGTIKSIRVDQEARFSVLRIVMESGGNRIPVEMRGNIITGVIEQGDNVVIKRYKKRQKDGVIRPKSIINITTNSVVSVKRKNVFMRMMSFIFGTGVSIATAVVSAAVVAIPMMFSQAAVAADGEALYKAKGCAGCHAPNAMGAVGPRLPGSSVGRSSRPSRRGKRRASPGPRRAWSGFARPLRHQCRRSYPPNRHTPCA